MEQRYRELLSSEDTTATVLFEVCKRVLGNGFQAWEPDSIWTELADQGVDPDLVVRDKIMAVLTLLLTGGFYWDAAPFENISLAFNAIPIAPDAIQEASPAQLSWAVFEAQFLMHRENKEESEFDYEPSRYTAAALFREGFVVAPEMLDFAQDELDHLNRGNLELKNEIMDRWKVLNKDTLSTARFEENPLETQLAKLAAVYMYVRDMSKQLQTELSSLPSRS